MPLERVPLTEGSFVTLDWARGPDNAELIRLELVQPIESGLVKRSSAHATRTQAVDLARKLVEWAAR